MTMTKVGKGMPSSNEETFINIVDAPLIASFTHQIINPLNGVVGTIDNLIDGTITAQRREQRLKATRAQLSHTIEMVRNLAYLSQLTTAEGRESLRNVGGRSIVPEIVIEAAMFFQEIARSKGMEISLQDRDTQYIVFGPKDLLRQVFTNLLENAVKYGNEGSEIIINTRIQNKFDRSPMLIVEVENTGPGFSNDMKEKIFERGFRGPEAKRITSSGSGLGLYICRDILDVAFSASIEAEHSSKNSKTVFRMRFQKFHIDNEQ